ncbi:Trna methyltransferase [Mycena sanguinolenta]|uniref:Trna methyltransferase n=1 Tax=Mycena sanguinolenta TaxID=230812 RepID=A0A8H6YQJ2_9AGAR|nr:Trna methyltransferase [Mycena sanguinolenta]
MAPAVTATVVAADAPASYEETHVHQVYDSIASHFSSTRYKPWPIIAAFLADLRDGWVGLDSGTGNGKYLPLPADPDRPNPRARYVKWYGAMCSGTGGENMFFYDSPPRYARTARPRGQTLIVGRLTLARTRPHLRVGRAARRSLKRSIPSGSSGAGQDVFVPWVLSDDKTQVFNRYYHMFDDGELAGLVALAAEELSLVVGPPSSSHLKGVEIVQDGWERSNHYVELRRWQTQQ